MSANIKSPVRTEHTLSRLIRSILLIFAVVLIWLPRIPFLFLDLRFLPQSDWYFWIGVIITAGGLSFSIWARGLLGKNWSQAVTVKEDHQLITSGAYALVRHPIYTGFILGFVGSSVALGECRGLISVALVFGVLLYKLRLEDKWLQEQFGESYELYCQRVSVLIPFIL